MSWQQENYDRAMEDGMRPTQRCPWCKEEYTVSIHTDPEVFDNEAQDEHETFCVTLLESYIDAHFGLIDESSDS